MPVPVMRNDLEEMVELNALSGRIVDACLEVHRELGPGWNEDHDEEALCIELEARGMDCARQIRILVAYKGITLRRAHRLDIIVESNVIIEVKAVKSSLVDMLKGNIRRVVNGEGILAIP